MITNESQALVSFKKYMPPPLPYFKCLWNEYCNENINIYYIYFYLFKLHITPIWVKQLQYKSMQTYKRKTTQT